MHKTLIALAIAGMAAAPAFADSNVTLYGAIDYGYGLRSGDSGLAGKCNSAKPGPGCPKQGFESGVSVPDKLGFKGAEDLGNGTKAIFELEMGYNLTDGNNSIGGGGYSTGVANGIGGGLFRRHAWMGLTGEWGTLLGGRVDGGRYGVLGRYDPFEQGSVANAGSLQIHAQRADNAIVYVTPNYQGLYGVVAYTSQLTGTTNAYNTGDARLWLVQPNYVNGPISATFDYERLTVHNSPADASINIYVVGLSYDFGVAKLFGYWEHVKTNTSGSQPRAQGTGAPCTAASPCLGYSNAADGSVLSSALWDQQSWLVGLTVPITENDKARFSYVDYDDRTGVQNSCRKWGIGGLHFLSKRTNLYVDYASINQRDKGACTIGYTPTKAGTNGDGSNATGIGTRGVDFGMTTRF